MSKWSMNRQQVFLDSVLIITMSRQREKVEKTEAPWIPPLLNESSGSSREYSVGGIYFTWQRLEEHFGSRSKSRRSAAEERPSWQQRYGITMVYHSHTPPLNNAGEGPVTQTESHMYLPVWRHSHTAAQQLADLRINLKTKLRTLHCALLCVHVAITCV